jgi:ribosomal protein S6--L-glutamate ligase
MIIRGNRQLEENHHRLSAGDVFIGRPLSGSLRLALLIDLLEQGVHCLPPVLAQSLHGSKTAQAITLSTWMLPHTKAIRRRSDLIEAINDYGKHGIDAVVTKQEHMHCGHGVRSWENMETLYNVVGIDNTSYPFVLQPFMTGMKDVRVIIAGNYVEAYVRCNPSGFRMNLSAGGQAEPYKLNEDEEAFCRSVMKRGKFPYAHLDLQILDDGACYLAEISLGGGLKGAKIDREQLDDKKKYILEKMASKIEEKHER